METAIFLSCLDVGVVRPDLRRDSRDWASDWGAGHGRAEDVVPVHTYPRGNWGQKEADALLPDGETWDDPEP